MFQPFIPSESPDVLQDQFSVFTTVVREFVEELYGLRSWRPATVGSTRRLRHEVCTVLIIEDPGWYERECGELRICDEYLKQCQQTDLLPDQRWVQLPAPSAPSTPP
jgi:hypothetical protein